MINQRAIGSGLFMKMEYDIKQDLKSPENCINPPSLPIKNPLVSFLPDKIHRDGQGYSFH
jgi:hypothetical protein